VTPEPAKRPKASYLRFAAQMPNETWQSDFTHYRLATGTDTQNISWLDDHSRLALHLSAHARITGLIVLATFRQVCQQHGYPASRLTDNGTVYTTRFAGGRGGRNHLEMAGAAATARPRPNRAARGRESPYGRCPVGIIHGPP
jgi:Integrase core domain